MAKKHQVVIDSEKCIGCGMCNGLCPKVFFMNEEGVAEAVDQDVDAADLGNAEEAMENCPVGAIEEQQEGMLMILEGCQGKKDITIEDKICPNCGAELMADENTTATKCVYCKSTTVIKERLSQR